MVEHKDAFGSVCIPDDWSLIPLGKCVTDKLSYGINAPAIPFDGKSPAYIRITDITEDGRFDNSDRKAVQTQERDKYLLREGDIVLARTGASTGKSYLYDERDGELVYAGFLIKASIDMKQHNPRFIVGQLRTPRYWSWVAAMSMRSGQPGINGKEYSSFLVPVAPKKEQDAIANTLSEFDGHIANLAELIEKKKAIRDGALEDLMNGRTRLEGFQKDWVEVPIVEVLREKVKIGPFGSQLKKESLVKQGEYKVYGQENIYSRNFHIGERFLTKDHFDRLSSCEILPGDFLMSTMGTIGKCAIAPNGIKKGIMDSHLIRFRINEEVLLPEYLLQLFSENYSFLSKQTERLAVGGIMDGLSVGIVNQLVILMPTDVEEQKAIADVLTAMDDEIKALEDERDKMIQIREGAMDDLLTGRVRLKV